MKTKFIISILCLAACQDSHQEKSWLEVDAQSLPFIYNFSGHSSSETELLARQAFHGMGFKPSDIRGPNRSDLIFVNSYYLVWLDQTGFYGKMNGLWPLNNQFDFVLKDSDGRPVNLFIVGENGDGKFPEGYKGAEHVEFPNRTPELNDDPNCANKDWCNQYSLNEASWITNAQILHWSACNQGSVGFDVKFNPYIVELNKESLTIIYEGPLLKEADGDGNWDGDQCHDDYLFTDGIRRRVNLQVGYQLFAHERYFDRIQKIINPKPNPELIGNMGLIGGFVLTSWPNPHPLKNFRSNILSPNEQGDAVIGWNKKPFSFSTDQSSVTVSNVGSIDNDDAGGCFCSVHGAIEIGGGLIHSSIPSGKTLEGRRRFTITQGK